MTVLRVQSFRKAALLDVILVSLLITYFLHFALRSLPAHFRNDDLMNMHYYWSAGAWKSIRANLFFWTWFERPLPAFYYLPLHHFFDLNPRPYRIVTISLVGATIPVAYLLARSLSASRSVAFLAVFAWCYHPRLANLVFIDAFIYDVLCALFYLTALAWYVAIRETGRLLSPLQLFGCFVAYLCALNSKEMAVTLPVMVLIYELLKYCHEPCRKDFSQWIWRNASPALVAGLIAAIYCYAKMYGPDGVYVHSEGREAYMPQYSWHAFGRANANFISQLFYLGPHQGIPVRLAFAAWGLVFLYAFLRRDRMVELMAFWVVITPLPLAFVVPVRGEASLVLPFFGWAMIFAKLVSDVIGVICKSSIITEQRYVLGALIGAIVLGGVSGYAVAAAIGALAGAAAVKLPSPRSQAFAIFVVALGLAIYNEQQNHRWIPPLLKEGKKEAHIISAFRALDLRPRPASKILLIDNPLAGTPWGKEWATLFIPKLLWNDHSLTIWLEKPDHILNAEERAGMDYILAVHEFNVDVIRQPR